MDPNEIRHRLTSALLQADEPLTLAQIAASARVPQKHVAAVLAELVDDGSVIESRRPGGRTAQYCWWSYWAPDSESQTARAKQELRRAVEAAGPSRQTPPDIDSPAVLAFNSYVLNEYHPPPGKRFLVFLQCSVRRPFSSSPSHASMRRAIWAATGYEPAEDFERCPVHVVVLASRIGPAPYEFEDCYPANVRGGGVKSFSPDDYGRVKPVLVERMAQYLVAHHDQYDQAAAFTEGRYAEVMEEAQRAAGGRCGGLAAFPIFPTRGGPAVVRMAASKPRTYWQKYWIQLYLAIVGWLGPSAQAQAEKRLRELDVAYALE